jgi:hypothetical protein
MNNSDLRRLVFVASLSFCAVLRGQTTETQEAPTTTVAKSTEPAVKIVLDQPVHIAKKAATLMAPKSWTRQKPKSRIVEHEFSIKPSDGDKNAGRMTVMASGGSIKDNLARWAGQFTQPDGTASKGKMKVTKKKVAGQDVNFVDISGTYGEALRGPFGPKVDRAGYRMLAAILELSKDSKPMGNYYIKLYGPAKTIKQNEKAFEQFVLSLKMN